MAMIALEWPSLGGHAGGVGRYTQRLCAALAPTVDITVFTGPHPLPQDGVTLVPVVGNAGRFDRYYLAPLRAARLVASAAPDLVHSHGDDWPVVFFGNRDQPVIRTYYGCSASEALTGSLPRRLNARVTGWLEERCRSRYQVAVGIGPDSVSTFGCEQLIPPVFAPAEPPAPPAKTIAPLVVFIGEFGSRKRGHLALAATVEVRRRVPDLRLAVVGPPRDRERYPPWVEFHPHLEDAGVRDLIGQAWVLLAPSSYEGFGIPAWEAMTVRTAVLGTPNPGLVFLAGDPPACSVVGEDDLGRSLHLLISDHNARERQVQRGFDRAAAVAELGRPERYLSIYQQHRPGPASPPSGRDTTLSVVVPAYRRPEQLVRCLTALEHQDEPADDVVVVHRDDDEASRAAAERFESLARRVVVSEPGQVAALRAGAAVATGEVIAFTDDDAEPRPDWCRRLRASFSDPSVGAAGGRDVVHGPSPPEPARGDQVGLVTGGGRVVGRHHLGTGPPRDVHHLKGVNMAIRSGLLRLPTGLRGEGAQVFNDLAVSLAVVNAGYRVVYDPAIVVDHYPAARFDEDGRGGDRSRRARADAAFNQSYVLFSLRPRRRLARLAYVVLWGDRDNGGMARCLWAGLRGQGELQGTFTFLLRAHAEAWRRAHEQPLVMTPAAQNVRP